MQTKISLQLPEWMLKDLQTLAKSHVHGSSISSVVRKAVMVFLETSASACTCNPNLSTTPKRTRGGNQVKRQGVRR
jgi:hypothetical protein